MKRTEKIKALGIVTKAGNAFCGDAFTIEKNLQKGDEGRTLTAVHVRAVLLEAKDHATFAADIEKVQNFTGGKGTRLYSQVTTALASVREGARDRFGLKSPEWRGNSGTPKVDEYMANHWADVQERFESYDTLNEGKNGRKKGEKKDGKPRTKKAAGRPAGSPVLTKDQEKVVKALTVEAARVSDKSTAAKVAEDATARFAYFNQKNGVNTSAETKEEAKK